MPIFARTSAWRASLALIALVLAAPGVAAAADRIALVIGNQDYDHAQDARGARDDARLAADALREAGYEVFDGYDLDSPGMRDLLDRFERSAREAAAVDGGAGGLAIYVSAQSVRAGGRSYVAPVDLDAATLSAVTMNSAPVELLLDLAALAPGRAVVMLDLARPRGFLPNAVAEPGFAEPDDPDGVLLIASAPPGRATRRRENGASAFARLAADEMLKPGAPAVAAAQSLAARMRDESPRWPEIWVAGATEGLFALVPAPSGDDGELRARMELEAWRAAEDSGARGDYQQYLRYFPDGVFADIARDRIAALDGKQAPAYDARRTEEALGLSTRDRARIQSRLTALGYDTRGVDGVFGPASRRAVADWQRDRGDEATGYLTGTQVAALRDEDRASPSAADEDRDDWDRASREDTVAAYEAYLAAHPGGQRAAEARDRIAALRNTAPSGPEAGEAALGLTRPDRIAVQRALTERGYDTRGVDGAFGPASRRAISFWQRDRGEAATGYLTDAQFAALTRAPDGRAPVDDRDEQAWRAAVDRNNEDAYRDYLRRYPNGRHAAEAERRIDDLRYRRQDVAAAQDEERRQNFTEGQRRSIEGRLAALGYDPGSQDGRFTQRTRDAIARFQRAQGIFDSGYADDATVQELVRQTPGVTQQELIGGAIGEIFRQLDN